MRLLLSLTAVLAIALVSLSFMGTSKVRPGSGDRPAATISVDELQRGVDVRGLPVQEFGDLV